MILEQGRPGGRVLLVDFGGVQEATAASADADGGAPPIGSTIIGTAGYMPPEQFAGAASPASDLYALGGVLLFLLSGRTPGQFKSERLRVSFEREVEVGPRMSALLGALLDPIAEDRPTASQVSALLPPALAPTPPLHERRPGSGDRAASFQKISVCVAGVPYVVQVWWRLGAHKPL